jgi:hypothetical protein
VYGHSIFGNPVYAESASVGSQAITATVPLANGATSGFGADASTSVPLTAVPVGGSVPILPPQIGPAPDFGISLFGGHVPFGSYSAYGEMTESQKKTLMYAGIGVGVLAIGGVIWWKMKGKK